MEALATVDPLKLLLRALASRRSLARLPPTGKGVAVEENYPGTCTQGTGTHEINLSKVFSCSMFLRACVTTLTRRMMGYLFFKRIFIGREVDASEPVILLCIHDWRKEELLVHVPTGTQVRCSERA